jgi:peptide methionine sulfoxide reductase msrA/msrB
MNEHATFAGGCFWCVQGPFDAEKGVFNVMVGYAGGTAEDAKYYTVASGHTQHREAIHMEFDPFVVPYRKLVEIFFRQIDPTDPDGQFADKGFQYTTAVYYHTPEQKKIVEEYIAELNASKKFDRPIATQVVPFSTFFEAEEDHQSYYKKNPLHYNMYKMGSGRAGYIKKTWKE